MKTTIKISSDRFIDTDNCLAAAQKAAQRLFMLSESYDTNTRWADEQRDEIEMDVPVEANLNRLAIYVYDVGVERATVCRNRNVASHHILTQTPSDALDIYTQRGVRIWIGGRTGRHAMNIYRSNHK